MQPGLQSLTDLARSYGDDILRRDVAFIVEQEENHTASVVFVGQFKRGKSTLLNALLGGNVLPTGRLPLTGVPTRVRFGDPALIVHYADNRSLTADPSEIAEYVTEERNPANRQGVSHVDLMLPFPLLRNLILVDTPGIGSTFIHNTRSANEATERIDLAIFVTGPEPPIGDEELQFLTKLKDLAEQVIVVLAKIDLAQNAEAEILGFTRRVLSATLPEPIRLLPVNATQHDKRVDALRETIREIVDGNDRGFGKRSLARRVRRIAMRIRHIIALQRATALLPAKERELARTTFSSIADEIDERGADLVRAIEQFPTEELVSVDTLLDDLIDEASTTLSADVPAFVEMGSGAGEREIYQRVAALETQWSARVSSALERRIEKRRAATLRLIAELERRFDEAGSTALGLRWDDAAIEASDAEFGAREAATRMTGPIPTTGLEIISGGLVAALPSVLRARALKKRYSLLVTELLDRSRGRVRSSAVSYLLEWRVANVGLVRERLLAARRAVEDAFTRASESSDDPKGQQLLQAMSNDEQTLDAIVAAFS